MLQTNNHLNQPYAFPQNSHPNPPPQSKIINSKDNAIQQLIYENTMLKKQLSELMLKNATSTPIYQLQNLNSMESAMTTTRPSAPQMGQGINSLFNSQELIEGMGRTFPKKEKENSHYEDEKMVMQRQMKRVNHHSVDNLLSWCQLPQQSNPMCQTKPSLYQNPTPPQNIVPLAVNHQQIHTKLQQHLNNNLHQKNHQEHILTEQEMYRDKMMKLKSRKISQSKRQSEQKPIDRNFKPTNFTPGVNQNFIQFSQTQEMKPFYNDQSIRRKDSVTKMHEVVKSKENSPERRPILKNKLNEAPSQKTILTQSNYNQMPLTHERKQQQKMIPKYQPKNFSREKQNKCLQQQKVINISILNPGNNEKTPGFNEKTVSRNTIQSISQSTSKQNLTQITLQKHEQKRVCLKQPRGRIYLDDEAEGGRTKRAHSKAGSNIVLSKSPRTMKQTEVQNQSTSRNNKKPQVPKKISIAESQITYVDADSFKRFNATLNNVEIAMMRKNSNQVYLEEEDGDKHKFKSSSRQKQQKQLAQQQTQQSTRVHRVIEQGNAKNKEEEIVSIEEIHLIDLEKKDTDKALLNQSTKRSTPPISKQMNNSYSRSKNLHNQIYCEESKKDLHS